MNKAVFLDRDGVINKMIYNESTFEYEPPHKKEDLFIFEWVYESLKKLIQNNFLLFIVSNQPDYAKGKTSLEKLREVHDALYNNFVENKIYIREYYYCYHHPDGIIKEYSYNCKCRKPKTFFIDEAVEKYNLDSRSSWFVGDRESDIRCGENAGLKTILINSNLKNNFGANFSVSNLKDAVEIILKNQYKLNEQ